MSSFSSVVQRPGKKIVPKAAPRRKLPRGVIHVSEESTPVPDARILNNEPATSQNPDQIHSNNESLPGHIENQLGTETQDSASFVNSALQVNAENVAPAVSVTSSEQTTTLPQRLSQTPEATQVTQVAADFVVQDNGTRVKSPGAVQNPVAPHVTGRANTRSASNRSTETRSEGDRQNDIVQPPAVRATRQSKAATVPATSLPPRKKRKTTPQVDSANSHLNLTPTVPESSSSHHPAVSPSPGTYSSSSEPPDDLLQSATRRAASVSELASNIESQTRLMRPQATQQPSAEPLPDAGSGLQLLPTILNSQPTRRRRKKTAVELGAEVVADALGNGSRTSRRRDATPENAESHELEPTKTKMSELCEDNKLGKKSDLEAEMQANWAEILQRRKEDRERALANAEKRRRKGTGSRLLPDSNQETATALAPAMALVNGVIVVDQTSREIDRGAQLQRAAVEDLDHIREDRNYYKYVNQHTVGVKPGHGVRSKWDEESTERFYKALRMFGTDFLMISNMFPGLTRKQIKTKFIREENADKARVLECLRNQEPVQIEDYAQMANKDSDEFHTMDSIQKELDEQERQLREEDNQRRKREGFAVADTVEGDDQNTATAAQDRAESHSESVEPGRFDAIARDIMAPAVTAKKRQRRPNATSNRRGPKGGRRLEGGVEEVLGSITEVAV